MRMNAWSRGQRWKNDVIFHVAVGSIRVGLSLPRRWLPWLGSTLGTTAYAIFGHARRATLENLALVYPHLHPIERRAMAREVFRTLGCNLTDTLSLLDPTESPERTLGITPTSRTALDEALRAGRGVVYVTCHLGPWERMAALLAGLGYPITTLASESYDPRFDAVLYGRLRTSRNVDVIYRGSSAAPLAVVRALKRGRVLGFLVDLPGRIATCPVQWLGRPSTVALGPARIALRTGAPVVIGTPAPGAGGLQVDVTALPTEDLEPGDVGERVLCQRIADELSRRIAALPSHWPWMHRSFETRAMRQLGGSAAHFGLIH